MEEFMATLNIKNLPDPLYRKLRTRARRERRSVAQEVIQILSRALEQPAPSTILALKGLGKDMWRKAGSTAHVERERRSWA